MNASLPVVLWWAGWIFFVYGPQMVLCLGFAYRAARRANGDMLNWLTAGFLWSLVPFVGVVAMWWLWRGSDRRRQRAPGESATTP